MKAKKIKIKEKKKQTKKEENNTGEKIKIINLDIPSTPKINSYFETIDLKNLGSYKNISIEEVNNGDTLFGNNYFKYFMNNKLIPKKKCFVERPKKFGNLFVFCFIRNQPLIVIGMKNICQILFYQFFLHFSYIFIHLRIIHTVFPYMRFMLTIFYLMNFLNHLYLVLINPGIPSCDNFSKKALKEINKDDRRYFEVCEICNIIVDSYEEVRHCNRCNICLKKMDHHCSWVGKCIAKNNYFTFQMLVFSTLLYYIWYFIVFIVWCIIRMIQKKHQN